MILCSHADWHVPLARGAESISSEYLAALTFTDKYKEKVKYAAVTSHLIISRPSKYFILIYHFVPCIYTLPEKDCILKTQD